MIEQGVVKDLIDQLLTGDKEQQASAATHIRYIVILLCEPQSTIDICIEIDLDRYTCITCNDHGTGIYVPKRKSTGLPLRVLSPLFWAFLTVQSPRAQPRSPLHRPPPKHWVCSLNATPTETPSGAEAQSLHACGHDNSSVPLHAGREMHESHSVSLVPCVSPDLNIVVVRCPISNKLESKTFNLQGGWRD